MSKTRLRRSDPERERYWRKVVRGQERSGQSVREYCRGAGVKESAFYWWRVSVPRNAWCEFGWGALRKWIGFGGDGVRLACRDEEAGGGGFSGRRPAAGTAGG